MPAPARRRRARCESLGAGESADRDGDFRDALLERGGQRRARRVQCRHETEQHTRDATAARDGKRRAPDDRDG